jgi:magnesium-transporting ATPase (P-type)
MAKKALNYGYLFDRDADSVSLKYPNEDKKFKIIRTFDFTNHRKVMTVVVECPEVPGKLIAFSKGADSSMMEMMRDKDGITTNDVFVMKKIERDLENF